MTGEGGGVGWGLWGWGDYKPGLTGERVQRGGVCGGRVGGGSNLA
jgi:hypothetical protein